MRGFNRLKKYVSCKIINAIPATCEEASMQIGRVLPGHPNDDGYLIEYGDGYLSWCPKSTFERDYKVLEGYSEEELPFCKALDILERGGSVTQKGWGCYLKKEADGVVRSTSLSQPTNAWVYEFSSRDIFVNKWVEYIES
jgi:hypothetical protein